MSDDLLTALSATGLHDTLVSALAQADLAVTLQGVGPFTVFAPHDYAFTAGTGQTIINHHTALYII